MPRGPELALVTGQQLDHSSEETSLTLEALAQVGLRASLHPWQRGSEFAHVPALIHTPWDYTKQPRAFRSWIEQREAGPPTLNPCGVLRWNMDKAYILELVECGVPAPRSALCSPSGIQDAVSAVGGYPVVVKPRVGAGGRNTHLVRGPKELPTVAGDSLVQEFRNEINLGEYSTMFFGGYESHTVLKRPVKGEFRIQARYGGTTTLAESPGAAGMMTDRMAELINRCVYARLDYIMTGSGPLLMELELIEPELFLRFYPSGSERLARAVRARLERTPTN